MRAWPFVFALGLAACQTQTVERDGMGLWKPGDSSGSGQPSGDSGRESRGTVITIPADVVKAQSDFVNQPSTIFSDDVEVDLSRNGWLALASFSVSRDAVTRRDEEDPARGVLTITIQRIPDVPVTKDSVPTVRFGDGMRVVGVDRVVLRFWSQQSADRPQWFRAAGRGQVALYAVDSEPRKEWRGRQVDVRAEILKAGDTYRFVSDAGAKP